MALVRVGKNGSPSISIASMSKTRGRPPSKDLLTQAEWCVVNAVRHGSSNPLIAKRLNVSLDAVKFHVSNAMQKLGFTSRIELRHWQGVAQNSELGKASDSNSFGAIRTKLNQPSNSRSPTMGAQKVEVSTTPLRHAPLEGIAQIARTVADIEAARTWFVEVAGLTHLYSFGKMAFFDCAGLRLMLSEPEPVATQSKRSRTVATHESILYFRVADIHAAHISLTERGAVFINAPHLVHRHADGTEEWMAFFQDNQARPLALVAQVAPPATQK